MSKFKQRFGNKKIILPVVHVENFEQALRNTILAKETGADGVFLINMEKFGKRISHVELREILKRIRNKKTLAGFWIGVNFLDLKASEVFKYLDESMSGLWTDDLERIGENRGDWDGIYFGGVSFKYQDEVRDHALAAKNSIHFVDVVTTSGKATGIAPDIEKIKSMKEAIGKFPLSVASGISVNNIRDFMPYVDCFIVASSLLRPGTEDFEKEKLDEILQIIKT